MVGDVSVGAGDEVDSLTRGLKISSDSDSSALLRAVIVDTHVAGECLTQVNVTKALR